MATLLELIEAQIVSDLKTTKSDYDAKAIADTVHLDVLNWPDWFYQDMWPEDPEEWDDTYHLTKALPNGKALPKLAEAIKGLVLSDLEELEYHRPLYNDDFVIQSVINRVTGWKEYTEQRLHQEAVQAYRDARVIHTDIYDSSYGEVESGDYPEYDGDPEDLAEIP